MICSTEPVTSVPPVTAARRVADPVLDRYGTWTDREGPVLSVELVTDGTECCLRLRGALCGTAIAALSSQIDQLSCTPCNPVVIDLRYLAEIDGEGIEALVGLNRYVEGLGGRLELTGARRQIVRACAVTPLDTIPGVSSPM